MTPPDPDRVTRETAARWAPACDEYFEDFQQGVHDARCFLQLILPVEKIGIEQDRNDLVIGHAGADGIYFCFREGMAGVYAYYGIEDEHRLIAPTLRALVDGWMDDAITV